jgi:hypothetical protein
MQNTGVLHVKNRCFLSASFSCKGLITNDALEATDNLMIGSL